MKVRNGDKVRVHYKGTLEDGTVFDSSEGREPLAFKVGAGQVIDGFEVGIKGMEEGERREISIPPEKAYGPHQDDLVGKLPAEHTANLDVREGSDIQVQTTDGETVRAKVVRVDKDGVVVDINHPLAGETLNFEVELVDLKREG